MDASGQAPRRPSTPPYHVVTAESEQTSVSPPSAAHAGPREKDGGGIAVGIDVGTAFARAAIWRHGQMQVLRFPNGLAALSSDVHFGGGDPSAAAEGADAAHLVPPGGVPDRHVVEEVFTPKRKAGSAAPGGDEPMAVDDEEGVKDVGAAAESADRGAQAAAPEAPHGAAAGPGGAPPKHGEVEELSAAGPMPPPGATAQRPAGRHGASGAVVYDAKRLLGRTDVDPVVAEGRAAWPFLVQTLGVGAKPLLGVRRNGVWRVTTAEEVMAVTILKLVRAAEATTGRPVTDVVLTAPVSFTRFQLAGLQRACQVAGVYALRVILEPAAVALVYAQQQQEADGGNLGSGMEKLALIYNLGAGFCDVAIAATAGGFCQIRALAGACLGGADLGLRLALELAKRHPAPERLLADAAAMSLLRARSEAAIEVLSAAEQADVELPGAGGSRGHDDAGIFVIVTRDEFERVGEPVFQKTMALVKQALVDARLEPDDVADVIPVGGAAAIPRVRALLQEQLGRRPFYDLGFDHRAAAARGAALEAAITSPTSAPGGLDLLMVTATPLHLGIRVAGGGGGAGGGDMHVVLPRNSTVPARHDAVVTTTHDNQKAALISVFEGSATSVADNHLLGHLLLTPLPPLPRGKPIVNVSMDVDTAGALRVLAGVYLPGGEAPVVEVVEASMPTVAEHQGAWMMAALAATHGSALDVALPAPPPPGATPVAQPAA